MAEFNKIGKAKKEVCQKNTKTLDNIQKAKEALKSISENKKGNSKS